MVKHFVSRWVLLKVCDAAGRQLLTEDEFCRLDELIIKDASNEQDQLTPQEGGRLRTLLEKAFPTPTVG